MKPLHSLTDAEFAELARRAAALPDAPAELVSAAISLWHSTSPSPTGPALGGVLRRVLAALTFDSAGAGALSLGMRSTGVATRHLLFTAEGRDIDLRVSAHEQRYALSGQVLGPDGSGSVTIAPAGPGGVPPRSIAIDEFGEFRIEGLEGGRYVLTLRFPEDEVELPPIDLDAAA